MNNIFKGFKKTAKAVLRKDETKSSLLVNKIEWQNYFQDAMVKSEFITFMNNMRAKGPDITGLITCKGGGFKSQLYAIMDAIRRGSGESVRQDCRRRWRNMPGLRGVNKGAVHNKR
jgi:ribosomal protein S9